MKKVLSLLFIILLCVGCGKEETTVELSQDTIDRINEGVEEMTSEFEEATEEIEDKMTLMNKSSEARQNVSNIEEKLDDYRNELTTLSSISSSKKEGLEELYLELEVAMDEESEATLKYFETTDNYETLASSFKSTYDYNIDFYAKYKEIDLDLCDGVISVTEYSEKVAELKMYYGKS